MINLCEYLICLNLIFILFMLKGFCVFIVGYFFRLKIWVFVIVKRKNSFRICRSIVNILKCFGD